MAPPLGARPGWSRRAQYGLFFGFLATIAGLVVGLALLVLTLGAPNAYTGIRGATLDLTAPITGTLRDASTTVTGLVGGAGDYWNAARQNAALKADQAVMRRQIVQARAIANENRQLKAALNLRERSPDAVAVGRIVGSSFESQRRFAIISVGRSSGADVGMPVVSPDGLIGRVVDVGNTASRVLLISDRSNIVPARILRNGQAVISTGRGDGTLDLRPLEVGRNPFRRGDVVVTSGTGGIYAPNIALARVVRLDDDGAIAVPLADPSDTSFAQVQPAYEAAALASDAEPAAAR